MGFRFTKRITIAPGIRANLSRSGVSLGLGGRGHWLTIGPRGTRTTVGLPGTGLYYTTTKLNPGSKSPSLFYILLGFFVVYVIVKSVAS